MLSFFFSLCGTRGLSKPTYYDEVRKKPLAVVTLILSLRRKRTSTFVLLCCGASVTIVAGAVGTALGLYAIALDNIFGESTEAKLVPVRHFAFDFDFDFFMDRY